MHQIQVPSPSGEDPLEKEMATHCSILAWRILERIQENSGQRSLVGYSPWGHKESDMAE